MKRESNRVDARVEKGLRYLLWGEPALRFVLRVRVFALRGREGRDPDWDLGFRMMG